VDDGLLEFRVLDTDGTRVRAEVVEGGHLGEHKGINLPGVALRAEALSEKDREDIAFGLSHGVDYVGLSFVRTPEDVGLCRAEMERAGRVVPIVAKIEKPEALEDLDAIIAAADGVMVARGDLGVEILPERVPLLQKEICRKANAAGKPVIIATQMLNSMIEHPRPTRAEASDVANGVWDGADAVMLSGETASGRYPVLALQMMDRIVREAEAGALLAHAARVAPPTRPAPFNLVTAAAACDAAEAAGAVAICCFTLRGDTARLLSHFRPRVPIIAFSPDQSIRRRLALYWGVVPKVMEPIKNADLMAELVSDRLLEDKAVQPGDRVVLVHGSPLGLPGQTNSIRLHEITHPSDRGPAQRYRVPI
jgi:pyruvate kinase